MHDGSAPGWRETIDRHHTALVEDLTIQLNSEIESRVADEVARARAEERLRVADEVTRTVTEERARAQAEAVRVSDEARRRLSESLNQALRRIRQASAEEEIPQLLVTESASCADRAVVLLIENDQASAAAWRDIWLRQEDGEAEGEPEDAGISFGLETAPAVASCAESRDPVVAIAAAGEISALLALALSAGSADKAYLFPITVRQNTVAILVASGAVTPAPLELLCEAAGMKLESLAIPPAPPGAAIAPLVQIAGASRTAEPPATWSKLTPEEQALHLRAQRTAKVRVAQIRISESDALRQGVQAGDIYGALRQSIDRAREEYRGMYISQSPTMVDYLHLELLRSLAHDDSRLLGPDYPGPIA